MAHNDIAADSVASGLGLAELAQVAKDLEMLLVYVLLGHTLAGQVVLRAPVA